VLQKAIEGQKGKALHMMVAAGPFTQANDLLYEPLLDLLDLCKRDKPHVLILMGPFLDTKSVNLQDGDICYPSDDPKSLNYLDYEDLMRTLMKVVQTELQRQNTQVVLIPSARDINHIYPLP